MTPTVRIPEMTEAAVDALLASVHGNAVAMINFARTLLLANGKIERARDVCREALALEPNNGEALALSRSIMSEGIGNWYFTMVQDAPRHALYERALKKVLANGGVVLDIGAGTGVFAMLAVRAGATHVIACERDPEVARAAAEIIKLNGYADRITLLPIDSRELELGGDLAERADVLLWDNLANNFIGAGCAATLADAKSRLVKPGAPVVPCRAELIAAPVTNLEIENHLMGVVDGIDMTPFNELRGSDFTLADDKVELRGEPVTLFDFDVSRPDPIRAERVSVPVSLTAGSVDGISQWLRFHLTDGITYETRGDEVRAFGAQYHTLEPFDASDGDTIQLHGAHDTIDVWLWADR